MQHPLASCPWRHHFVSWHSNWGQVKATRIQTVPQVENTGDGVISYEGFMAHLASIVNN
jgi:hypothetical protein